MKTRALTMVVVVLALAAAAAGCGGGGGGNGGSTTTLSKSDFAAKISQICTTGKQKIADVGLSLTSISGLKNVGDKIIDLENEQINQFKDVQPPDEIKSQADAFISKAETARDKLKQLVDAAKAGDTTKMTTLVPEVSSSGTAVSDAASAFGATC